MFDLPEVRPSVIEHQLFGGVCHGCGQRHVARAPRTVPSGQMGPGLIAWIAMMGGAFHLSVRQIQRLLAEQWKLPFSLGAMCRAREGGRGDGRAVSADSHRSTFSATVTAAWVDGRPLVTETLEPFVAPVFVQRHQSGRLRARAADGSTLPLDAGNGDPDSFQLTIETRGNHRRVHRAPVRALSIAARAGGIGPGASTAPTRTGEPGTSSKK